MPIGIATFPGVNQIRKCTYTLSHGITPGAAVLEITPQRTLPSASGSLVFSFDNVTIALPDCQVNALSAIRNASGDIWTFQILDRRWKWQAGGAISGSYNLRNDDETLDLDTEKSPQELAALLLDAMGEAGYDVGELPNDSRPMVQWAGDNPAQMLVELVDKLGCHVVWQLNNRVKVCRLGVGSDLPDNQYLQEDGGEADPQVTPDLLRVQFGPTLIQAAIVLEAVGLDLDGKIKNIEQLSYKPAGGWGKEIIGQFTSVPDLDPLGAGNPNNNPRSLALRTVYRWYRIFDLLGDFEGATASIFGSNFQWSFDDIKLILPLFPNLVDIDQNTGLAAQPTVQGTFQTGFNWTNSAKWTDYKQPFQVNLENGVVDFSEYVFKWKTNGVAPQLGADSVQAADMYLHGCFAVQHQKSRHAHRYTRDLQINSPSIGTGPRIIKQEELSLTLVCRYNATGTITNVATNQATVDAEADYQLAAVLSAFQTKSSRSRKYAGLLPINPDGVIQQIEWSVEQGIGCFTKASSNTEFSLSVPSYADRRLAERTRYDRVNQRVQQLARDQQLRGGGM